MRNRFVTRGKTTATLRKGARRLSEDVCLSIAAAGKTLDFAVPATVPDDGQGKQVRVGKKKGREYRWLSCRIIICDGIVLILIYDSMKSIAINNINSRLTWDISCCGPKTLGLGSSLRQEDSLFQAVVYPAW